MELIHGTHKASKFSPQDFISNMPDNVVTNILNRLPLQNAVRTSMLSRNWRFKWTILSQLVFDGKFFEYLKKTKRENNCGIISRLLLHIRGVIEKFDLSICDSKDIDNDLYINHCILFLSTKSIKDLTLRNGIGTPLKMPTHLFSCLDLKHLKIARCYFKPPPNFSGFPNLLSLELVWVNIKSSELGEILTRSPSLKILDLGGFFHTRKFKLVDITKSKNMKILSLSLCNIEAVTISSSTIFELVGLLPNLQWLRLDFELIQQLGLGFLDCKLPEGGAIKRFPIACLKALNLSRIDLGNGIMLSCVFEMISHFPNLQKLKILATHSNVDPIPIPEVEYNTTGLRSMLFTDFAGSDNEDADPIPEIEYKTTGLRSVVFKFFKGSENEVCFDKVYPCLFSFPKRDCYLSPPLSSTTSTNDVC